MLAVLTGIGGLVYEARFANPVSPEIVVGCFGLIVSPAAAGADYRGASRGKHRRPVDEDD